DRRGRFGAFVGDQYDDQDNQRDDDRDCDRNRPAIATALVVYGRRVAGSGRYGWATRTRCCGRIATARWSRRISRARRGFARTWGRRRQWWLACGTVITIVQGRLPFSVSRR